MPIKSLQHFALEQRDSGKLIVNKNTKNKVLLIKIAGNLILVFYVLIPLFFKSLGLWTTETSPIVVAMVVIYYATKDAASKGSLVFDKKKDLFSVNGQNLAMLSKMSYLEINTFVADEDQLEMYRIYLVSEETPIKFNIWEAKDETDINTLANELSLFLGIPELKASKC